MEEFKISTLADVVEYEKIPLTERMIHTNTYDLIKHGASLDPEAIALSLILSGDAYENPIQVNFETLMGRINQTANLFHDLGVRPGDVISILLPNIPQTHYIFWGGEAAGIANPINPMLDTTAIHDICVAVDTKVLVALGDIPGIDIWEKADQLRKSLPNLKATIRVMGPSDEAEGIYGFDEIIDKYNADGLDSGRIISPDDIASILHTGGTTGTPKLAPRTHMNEASMAFMIGTTGAFHQGETVLGGLPLFHNYGLMGLGLYPFSIGAHVVMLSPSGFRDESVIKNFWKITDKFKPASFAAVPTVLSTLLNIPKEDNDISSLRFIFCGAAPLSVELGNKFEKYAGVAVVEGYGLTEGTTASSINPVYGERKIGSVGLRWPYQNMEIFILDDDLKFVREAETNEIGAVCINGPNVFTGYLDDRHNQGIWAKEGWLNTGDLGRLDDDGYYWITGRKKELIIRGGHNIDPAAVEEPLYRLAGVQVAAVIGRPDQRVGEMPIAYVQTQEGSDLTPEKILEYLQSEITERAAIPKEVIIMDEIPLTMVGKIFKPALRWDSIKKVFLENLKALGNLVESVDIVVGEDKLHGSMAEISIKAAPGVKEAEVEEKIDQILAGYTTRHIINFV